MATSNRTPYYEQLYAQAMEALYANERYWFDAENKAIITIHNQEFEEKPAVEQLFYVYFRAEQIVHFGRMLSKLQIESRRKTNGTHYHVVRIEAEKE